MEFRQTNPYHSRKYNSNDYRFQIITDTFSRPGHDFSDCKKYITQEQTNENQCDTIIHHANPSIPSGSMNVFLFNFVCESTDTFNLTFHDISLLQELGRLEAHADPCGRPHGNNGACRQSHPLG